MELPRKNTITISESNKSPVVNSKQNSEPKTEVTTSTKTSSTSSQEESIALARKSKRLICSKCKFPTLKACICPSLPTQPISLTKCRLIVLQHPHEVRRKNRSLPLLQLCILENNMQTAIGRCLDEDVDKNVMDVLLNDNNVMLVFPSEDSIDLEEGIEEMKKRIALKRQQTESRESNSSTLSSTLKQDDEKITLLFIDATWKHAKEMYEKTTLYNNWPENMLQVKLSPSLTTNTQNYKPNRFNIRSTPSFDQMSTAECIAFVLSILEEKEDLYDILMKPLDYMVNIWNSFEKDRRNM